MKINCLFSAAFLHLHHLIRNEILQPATEYLSNIFTSFILGEYLMMQSTVNDYRSLGTWSFPSFFSRMSPAFRAASRAGIRSVLASAPRISNLSWTHTPPFGARCQLLLAACLMIAQEILGVCCASTPRFSTSSFPDFPVPHSASLS